MRTAAVIVGCCVAAARSGSVAYAADTSTAEQQLGLVLSASGWGCPFTQSDTNPCTNDACLESRSEGEISQGCCTAIAEYCEASLSNEYMTGQAADPACSGKWLLLCLHSQPHGS